MSKPGMFCLRQWQQPVWLSPPRRKAIPRRISPYTSPSRPAGLPTSSGGWLRPSSKAASNRASWWRTAAAPAATSRPRRVFTDAPDGYTLLATTTGLAVNMTASKNRGFEMGDVRPVAIVAISPDVLAVHPDNPARTLKEFMTNAMTKSFTYGSAGVGTGPHIGAEYFFKEAAKVQYVHVPFQGGAPAITALLGNHIDALVLTLPPVTPHIKSGALRGLASPRRSAIPLFQTCRPYGEMGYPDVYSQSWVGFSRRPRRPMRSFKSSTPRSTR